MLVELTHWFPHYINDDPAFPVYDIKFLINPEDVASVLPNPSYGISQHPAGASIKLKSGGGFDTHETYDEVKRKLEREQRVTDLVRYRNMARRAAEIVIDKAME